MPVCWTQPQIKQLRQQKYGGHHDKDAISHYATGHDKYAISRYTTGHDKDAISCQQRYQILNIHNSISDSLKPLKVDYQFSRMMTIEYKGSSGVKVPRNLLYKIIQFNQ